MACEHCVSRRAFLATAAGAATAVALAACGDGEFSGISSPIISPPAGPVTLKVGDFPALASNDLLVQVPNHSIAVKRTGASAFEALSMLCTHQGCLTQITLQVQFECPCHGSKFSNTGQVTAGPAERPLPKFTTSYDAATDILTIS
jgi:cytochrome b6-f complex iron-sulfur subunit